MNIQPAISFDDIQQQFLSCKIWEEKYRLLIRLSRHLTKPTDIELAEWKEIHGCESRLWYQFTSSPPHFHAYSEARLMQGLLVIIISALNALSLEKWEAFDIQTLFEPLQITRHLTATRLNGLKQLEREIRRLSSSTTH